MFSQSQNSAVSVSTPLQALLDKIRVFAGDEREKGAAFEALCTSYLQAEPKYASLYANVQSWTNWVATHGAGWGLTTNDKGIDLVATTHDGAFHAIQCKCYAPDHIVAKADIDSFISARNIPLQAYDYVVNGRAALDWVMERQGERTSKDNSGIVSNANCWATETMNNPKYPLELLLRVITLPLKTREIVQNLPKLL